MLLVQIFLEGIKTPTGNNDFMVCGDVFLPIVVAPHRVVIVDLFSVHIDHSKTPAGVLTIYFRTRQDELASAFQGERERK